MYVCVCVCVHVHSYTHACVRTCVCMCMCARTSCLCKNLGKTDDKQCPHKRLSKHVCINIVVEKQCVAYAVCVCEGLTHRMWTEVSFSVPHFPQVGLLLNPIIYKCLLRVLFLVGGPVTALGCVLLKDSNQAFVAGLGPEINSRACL
jgi:hypothetical protein